MNSRKKAFYSICESMRKKNRRHKIPDGNENSLILVTDENQLRQTENQTLVSTPRQDKELISLIEAEEYKAAKAFADEHYSGSVKEAIKDTYPFLRDRELETAFDKALDQTILNVEDKTIYFNDTDKLVGATSVLSFLTEAGLSFTKNQLQHRDKNKEDYEAIQAIMRGDDKSFIWAYRAYRSYFIGYAKRQFPGCSDEIVMDAYQDALIVLIEDYIRKERFCLLGDWIYGLRKGTKIKTFIVSIGRRMLARNCGNKFSINESYEDFDPETPETWDNSEWERKLLKAIGKIKKRCKRLLFYKYWLGLSYEDIKNITNARSAGSVRVMTKRCRDEIEALMDEMNDD